MNSFKPKLGRRNPVKTEGHFLLRLCSFAWLAEKILKRLAKLLSLSGHPKKHALPIEVGFDTKCCLEKEVHFLLAGWIISMICIPPTSKILTEEQVFRPSQTPGSVWGPSTTPTAIWGPPNNKPTKDSPSTKVHKHPSFSGLSHFGNELYRKSHFSMAANVVFESWKKSHLKIHEVIQIRSTRSQSLGKGPPRVSLVSVFTFSGGFALMAFGGHRGRFVRCVFVESY